MEPKIKIIKTNKFEGLAVLVPNDASGFTLKKTTKGKPDQLHYFVPYTLDVVSNQRLVIIPTEGFKILGKATELTEEQCAEIVPENLNSYKEECYPDFTPSTNDLSCAYVNAKLSFESLIQSIGCYSVNPYGGKPNERDMLDFELVSCFEDAIGLWEEAQANTGTRLIIQKV